MVIFYLTEQHIYGSARLGMRKPNLLLAKSNEDVEIDLTMSSHVLGEKRYELTNHLGNVLAVVSDKRNGDEPDIVSVSDYYPYGMLMPDRNYDAEEYRYGFGGHEKDDEVIGEGNHLSFGDYGYDPRLGRRWDIDPLYVKYPFISSYATFISNPISNIDPDGCDAYLDEKGEYLYNDNDGEHLRLIDNNTFIKIQKEIRSEAKEIDRRYRNSFVKEQMRERLREEGVSTVLTINNKEIDYLREGEISIDGIYRATNERNREVSVDVVINTQNFTIELGIPVYLGPTGGNIPKKDLKTEFPSIANIHGHPDKRNNRFDGRFPTQIGESDEDRDAAVRFDMPIYNIEKGKIYYYTPNSNFPIQYKGDKNTEDVLLHVVKFYLNRK